MRSSMKKGSSITNYSSLLLMSVQQPIPMSLTHLLIFVILSSSWQLVNQGLWLSISKLILQDELEYRQQDFHFLMMLHIHIHSGSLVWNLQVCVWESETVMLCLVSSADIPDIHPGWHSPAQYSPYKPKSQF